MYVRAIDSTLPFWIDRSAPVSLARTRRVAGATAAFAAPPLSPPSAVLAGMPAAEAAAAVARVAEADAQSPAGAHGIEAARRRIRALREAVEERLALANDAAAAESLRRLAFVENLLTPQGSASYGDLLAQGFQGSLYVQPVRHLTGPFPVKGIVVDSVI